MKPHFDANMSDPEYGCLACPACKEPYTHHIGTVIFNRPGEDQPPKLITDCRDDYILRWLPDNPSARRDGIRILFWCESCRAVFEMTIAQHKGNTYLECKALPGWTIDDQDIANIRI